MLCIGTLLCWHAYDVMFMRCDSHFGMQKNYATTTFVEFGSEISEEKSKMSLPIRGQGAHLVFLIGPKNTNLVEDVQILLPVKFR